jgi:oligopeptidase B
MLDYSPYDNIYSGMRIPPIYISAGLEDSRVPYWEPVKFIAKLRTSQSNSQNVLLRVTGTGHFSTQQEWTEIYSFILYIISYDPAAALLASKSPW